MDECRPPEQVFTSRHITSHRTKPTRYHMIRSFRLDYTQSLPVVLLILLWVQQNTAGRRVDLSTAAADNGPDMETTRMAPRRCCN